MLEAKGGVFEVKTFGGSSDGLLR